MLRRAEFWARKVLEGVGDESVAWHVDKSTARVVAFRRVATEAEQRIGYAAGSREQGI